MQKILLSLFILSTLAIISCKKDDNTPLLTNANVRTAVTTTPNWKVTLYTENGVFKTSNYNGFGFVFNTNGSVVASNGILSVSGTWAIGTDDSNPKLLINFSGSSFSIFQDISEDWQVQEATTSIIKLIHVSGGGGGTDYLTFEKI
jgi:hypothetical protein